MNPILRKYLLDPFERAASTFVQQLVIVLLTATGASLLVTQNWAVALDSAGFAALLSLATSLLTFWVSVKPPAVDLALRLLKTFVQSVLGTLLANNVQSVVHADWKGALSLALPVTLAALLKGIAAFSLPGTIGASLLPAPALPDAEPTEADYAVPDETYTGAAVTAEGRHEAIEQPPLSATTP